MKIRFGKLAQQLPVFRLHQVSLPEKKLAADAAARLCVRRFSSLVFAL
jgi:hypothetical protein